MGHIWGHQFFANSVYSVQTIDCVVFVVELTTIVQKLFFGRLPALKSGASQYAIARAMANVGRRRETVRLCPLHRAFFA
jgi:hypothetical protein